MGGLPAACGAKLVRVRQDLHLPGPPRLSPSAGILAQLPKAPTTPLPAHLAHCPRRAAEDGANRALAKKFRSRYRTAPSLPAGLSPGLVPRQPGGSHPVGYCSGQLSGASFASFKRSASFSANGIARVPTDFSCTFFMKPCRIVSVFSKIFFPSLSVSQ